MEQRTMRKVSARLIPFLIVCYFVAYLDRTNVGFAALTMRQDLNISATAYGFGAGIFFLSYFLFEVPSNLFLERFGARRWIARIMFTWGILSGAMAFIGGEYSFYIVRLLLGAAEAGFFPGIIFYLTLWFPTLYRARIIGLFMAAIPGSTVIGAPLSSLLLYMDGIGGLKGWQWMFILEAAPAVILSFVVLYYLTDRPAEANWLEPDERKWLSDKLKEEQRQRVAAAHFTVGEALTNPRVLALAVVYFGAVATNYGISFWLPQIIKDFGNLSNLQIGVITAIPYAIGLVGMVWWSRRSDEKFERKGHAAIALAVAGIFIGLSTVFDNPVAQDGMPVDRGLRRVRGLADLLDAADRLPVGRGGRRRHRHDQRARQPRRFRRALCHGLDQGCDRQLLRRPSVHRRLRPRRHDHRHPLAARGACGHGRDGASAGIRRARHPGTGTVEHDPAKWAPLRREDHAKSNMVRRGVRAGRDRPGAVRGCVPDGA